MLGGMTTFARRLYHRNRAARMLLAPPVATRRALLNWQAHRLKEAGDRLASMICEDVVIDVPEFGGRFRCAPESHLFRRLILDGFYEPDLARIFQKYIDPDRDVIDVGANIGFYTVMSAQRLDKGRVLAIEPAGGAHARLIDNIERNGVAGKVVLFKGLASDKAEEVAFNQINGMEEYSSIGTIIHTSAEGAKVSESTALACPIDELVTRYGLAPAAIKIDIEGAEAIALRGATETLRKFRPVVLSELSPRLLAGLGSSAQEVIEMFHALDYEVVDPKDPSGTPGTRPDGDILCLPR